MKLKIKNVIFLNLKERNILREAAVFCPEECADCKFVDWQISPEYMKGPVENEAKSLNHNSHPWLISGVTASSTDLFLGKFNIEISMEASDSEIRQRILKTIIF